MHRTLTVSIAPQIEDPKQDRSENAVPGSVVALSVAVAEPEAHVPLTL
jgi:hypothetical protein